MKIHKKIYQLKNNIEDILNLSQKIDVNQSYKNKVEELNSEILRLKRGINENIEELEEILGEEDVRD